jgi:surface antigen
MNSGGPSEEFRAYLAPLAIEPGGAHVAERWAGVTGWVSKGTAAQVPALVAAMRGDSSEENRSKLQPFFAALVEADETFNTVNADQMIRVLAAAALDHAFTTSSALDTAASLAVVTSSWGNRAPAGLGADILARASAELENIAALARDRQDLGEILKGISAPALPATTPASARLKEGNFDNDTVATAIEEALKAVSKAAAAHANNVRSALEAVTGALEQAEEEVNVLWHVFGGGSEDGAASFAELDPRRSAFFAAREISDMTMRPLRTKVCAELFGRCGAKGNEGMFTEAVELMELAWIAEHASDDFSPSLFPIHRALARYSALVEPGAWIAGWSKETGIPTDLRVDPTALAVAFYRERFLLAELG